MVLGLIALRAGFYFDAVPEPRSCSFLLRGQKKRTKEKATRFLAGLAKSANPVPCAPRP
jgi:hypothetical protein